MRIGILDDILNDCVERLALGEKMEECVARYPDHKRALTPMLRTAVATSQVATSITIRSEAKARNFRRFTTAMAEQGRPRTSRFGWLRGWPPPFAKLLISGLGAIAIVGATAFGASAASENSVPGDPLYAVKTLKEDLSLMMPRSNTSKAKEHIRLANVRSQEIRQLVDRGRYQDAEQMVLRVTYHLDRSAQLVGVTVSFNPIEMPTRPTFLIQEGEKADLIRYLERDGRILRNRFKNQRLLIPPHQRKWFGLFMARWDFQYRSFMAALEAEGPAQWPVWITDPSR